MSAFTFPIGIHTPPKHTQALPDKVDVVIIGGGVIVFAPPFSCAVMGSQFSYVKKDAWQVNNPLVIGDGYASRDATLTSCPS